MNIINLDPKKYYEHLMWEFLKSAAATAKTKDRRYVFQDLVKSRLEHLIPFDDIREKVMTMIEDTEDISLFLDDENEILEWLSRVLDKDMRTHIRIAPNEFGPCYWIILCYAAGCAKDKLRLNNFKYLVNIMLPKLIPCSQCSDHWEKHLKDGPDNSMINSNIEMLRWIYNMKAKVDKSIDGNYRAPSFEDIASKYLN